MPVLLDTNVLSATRRPEKQDVAFRSYLSTLNLRDCFLTEIVVMEIKFGLEMARSSNPQFAADLETWLTQIVIPRFQGRLLPFTLEAALVAGGYRRKDPTIDGPTVDHMIAAIAETNKMPLVTRNVTHFASLGIEIINPWQGGGTVSS